MSHTVRASRSSRQTSLKAGLDVCLILLISAFGFTSLHFLHLAQPLGSSRSGLISIGGLITLGVIGTWRWGWFLLQFIRARFYQHWVFPKWRQRADRIPTEQLPPVCFLVPTYKEDPWVTEQVFRAIAREAKTLAQPLTLLVTSSSDAENAAIRTVLLSEDPELQSIRLIPMVQTGEGKRKAMADGLRRLAQLNLPADTVVALMDGDSQITPGTLRRCLPFFCLFPKMGALTTDELPIVLGSYWFSEWFHLRFAQRHHQMCAIALSRKVTCLTGRFSLFRSEATFAPSFADQLENDTLDDWLWGKFKFLSGDDKSTWYWLLKRQYEMLYIPDAIVYSIETISGSLTERAYQNMRRWYGNMLRNNGRAVALGPKICGWFTWWALIDQRLSVWLPLITPGFLLLSLLQQDWSAAGFITAWILASRPVMLLIYFINWNGRQSYLKPHHLPMLLVSQWSACLVKIWTQMNLAQQKWANRGNQSITPSGSGWTRWSQLGASRFLYLASLFSFAMLLSCLAGMLNPVQDFTVMLQNNQVTALAVPDRTIEAINYGLVPNDGQDDAVALQALIDQLPPQETIRIHLPIGEIDLMHPLTLNRSHTILQGQGIDRTILQARFAPDEQAAILTVRPASQSHQPIQQIDLSGFTLRQVEQTPEHTRVGILLEQLNQATVANLRIERSVHQGLALHQTQAVKVEYVAIDSSPQLTLSSGWPMIATSAKHPVP